MLYVSKRIFFIALSFALTGCQSFLDSGTVQVGKSFSLSQVGGQNPVPVPINVPPPNISQPTPTPSPSPVVSPIIVVITSPSSGAIVSGASVQLSASASGGSSGVGGAFNSANIASVEFKLGTTSLGIFAAAPYTKVWDSRTVQNGAYTLTAIATDMVGNTKSISVGFSVNNLVADTTPPVVNISAPGGGSTQSGVIAVSANATDNIGVVGVQFYVDNVKLGAEDFSLPYSASLDTKTLTNAAHSLKAIARDAAGNFTTSIAVLINVNNTVADTTPPTAPSLPKASAKSATQIDLSWTASTDNIGVAGYRIYRAAGANPPASAYTLAYSISGTAVVFSDASLNASTVYNYMIDAVDAAGNPSPKSAMVSATTLAAPPVGTACPNEPKGWTLLTDRHFTNGADPDWNSTGAFSMVRDATSPDGDGWIGRMTYNGPGLKRVGSATMASYYQTSTIQGRGYKSFYHCVAKRPSATFQTAPNNAPGTKQYWFQFGPTPGGCSENRVFTTLYGPTPSGSTASPSWGIYPIYPAICHQCLATATGAIAPSSPFLFNKSVSVQRGAWYWEEFMGHVESSHGTCDGWLAMYANGQLVQRVNNLCFTFPGDPLELANTKWNNTIGGGIAPCTDVNWKPANGATSQVIGGVTYTANNGVLPTSAQHPECFYPQTEAIDIDNERILVDTK